ncbi:cytochrome c3 family protein [Shewanella algae]|uniref:cytochrome c3 family protein n=1 Tax=Shewanella algae TaxID=38313 RepID=UPI001182E860|nr:cytochrome c3 family protein [Shewanella algae]
MKTSLISALLMGTLLASQAWAGELTKMSGSREGRSNHAFMYQEKNCKTCHLGAPKGPATETACLECHGDYQQIAEQTRDSKPNPHDAPTGEPMCPAPYVTASISRQRCYVTTATSSHSPISATEFRGQDEKITTGYHSPRRLFRSRQRRPDSLWPLGLFGHPLGLGQRHP